jgi:hypothetical protein
MVPDFMKKLAEEVDKPLLQNMVQNSTKKLADEAEELWPKNMAQDFTKKLAEKAVTLAGMKEKKLKKNAQNQEDAAHVLDTRKKRKANIMAKREKRLNMDTKMKAI